MKGARLSLGNARGVSHAMRGRKERGRKEMGTANKWGASLTIPSVKFLKPEAVA